MPNKVGISPEMTVLTIRSSKRYAVRGEVELSGRSGLMIELSAEGCRVSNLGDKRYDIGEEVDLTTPAGTTMSGRIRWSRGNVAGVRFDCALHLAELSEMLAACRGLHAQPQALYGT